LSLIELAPFDIQAIRDWLRDGFGQLSISPTDLKRLAEATGGNPYFLVEIVRRLLSTGAIQRRDAAWTVCRWKRWSFPWSISVAPSWISIASTKLSGCSKADVIFAGPLGEPSTKALVGLLVLQRRLAEVRELL
jgi:hypothetical protein